MSIRNKIENNRIRSFQRKRYSRKNTPINFTIDQLHNYSQTPTFYDIVLYHGWLDNHYTGDHAQNEKLMWIRKWWKSNVPSMEFVKTGKSVKFDQQLKLF